MTILSEQNRAIDEFVSREIIYCVSTLVGDVAGKWLDGKVAFCHLFDGPVINRNKIDDGGEEDDNHWNEAYYEEVFEHWIVSDHLANKLEEEDETIERDFHGLTVWGRTTTGQAISMDYVIRKIWYDLNPDQRALIS